MYTERIVKALINNQVGEIVMVAQLLYKDTGRPVQQSCRVVTAMAHGKIISPERFVNSLVNYHGSLPVSIMKQINETLSDYLNAHSLI